MDNSTAGNKAANRDLSAEHRRQVFLACSEPARPPRRSSLLSILILAAVAALTLLVAVSARGATTGAEQARGLSGGALVGVVGTGEKVAGGVAACGTTPLEKLEIFFAQRAEALNFFLHIFYAQYAIVAGRSSGVTFPPPTSIPAIPIFSFSADTHRWSVAGFSGPPRVEATALLPEPPLVRRARAAAILVAAIAMTCAIAASLLPSRGGRR